MIRNAIVAGITVAVVGLGVTYQTTLVKPRGGEQSQKSAPATPPAEKSGPTEK